MKVNTFQNNQLKEDYIDIYYKKMNPQIEGILAFLQGKEYKIIGKLNDDKHMLALKDIFYFETVDKKCFAYLAGSVYQVEYTLTEIESTCKELDFVRISKSVIVNIHKVVHLKSDINMRIHAKLENEELLVISRHYKKSFEKKLEEIKMKLTGGMDK